MHSASSAKNGGHPAYVYDIGALGPRKDYSRVIAQARRVAHALRYVEISAPARAGHPDGYSARSSGNADHTYLVVGSGGDSTGDMGAMK